MKVISNTDQYESSHGSKPKGRGFWGMEVMIEVEHRGCTSLQDVWHNGTLAEAKKAAAARAKSEAKDISGKLLSVIIDVLP